jgi:hypothetical protein
MSVKFNAQGNKGLLLMGFEPMQPSISRLLVQHVNHLAMPLPNVNVCIIASYSMENAMTYL